MCSIHILKNVVVVPFRARPDPLDPQRTPFRVNRTAWGLVALTCFVAGLILQQPAAAEAPRESLHSTTQENDADRPIRLARPTWDTGWFQAEIAAQLIRELGFTVDGPTTMENEAFYRAVDGGQVDLWVNGWFPLHDAWIGADSGATPVGFEVRGGALQGYLADRATVEALGITTLADLADPDVAAAFDSSGDGRADLIGCNPTWTCGPIVDHHLTAYGLNDTVQQVQGDYGPLMRDTVDRYRQGQPALFYTFTPNWTVGQLVPGEDVVWLPVPFPSLPSELADEEPLTVIPGIAGCLADPCALGFAPNDIRAVAGEEFLATNPAVETLLMQLEIPLDDISTQNARMVRGEDDGVAIEAHASEWIAQNRTRVDQWMSAAVVANDEAGRPALNIGTGSVPVNAQSSIGAVRVVTQIAPPFVTYNDGRYEGFSVELLELVAADVGADVELYAVNTSAKLIDDVSRQEADLGVGALAITARREETVDFTQPYFDSGLQILTTEGREGFLGSRLGSVARAVFSVDLLILILVLLTVLVLAAHVIWLTERGINPDFPKTYRAGIWESLWWAAVTATTVGYGDKTPKGPAGRVFGLFWMFSGLFVLAYFTAGIATAFTIDELNRNIDEPTELRGRAVGSVIESPATEFLDRQGIATTEFDTAGLAYDALLDGEVEAVVHDAAILQHFVATNERGGAVVSSLVFAELGFGFALPPGSELTEAMNRSLLGLLESGEFDELYEKWFGGSRTGEN